MQRAKLRVKEIKSEKRRTAKWQGERERNAVVKCQSEKRTSMGEKKIRRTGGEEGVKGMAERKKKYRGKRERETRQVSRKIR